MIQKHNDLIQKIINPLLNILIFVSVVILLFSIYIGIQTKILGNDYTNFFGYSVFEVQSGSMADTINIGDWVVVKLTKNVKLNDVVTYELDGEYITHRIISSYKDNYVTQGDANNLKDEAIKKDQIVGKVVKVLGKIGIIRATLFNPGVIITLVITLVLFNMMLKRNQVEAERPLKIKRNRRHISQSVDKNIKGHNHMDDVSDLIKSDDDLEKTMYYRNILVEADEVFSATPSEEEELTIDNLEPESEEGEVFDDKDILLGVIPVDSTDKEATLLEIAKYEMNKPEEEDINVPQVVEQPEEEEEALTDINLDMLEVSKNLTKGKNFIDTAMIIKKEEIEELIQLIIPDTKNHVRKVTIRTKLISTYIDAKYYNYFGAMNIKYGRKDSIAKIETAIKHSAKELLSSYDGNNKNFPETVGIYRKLLILIANLEHASDLIKDQKAKKEFYKKELQRYSNDWANEDLQKTIDNIILIQKQYIDYLNHFLANLETNMFTLKFNALTSNKNMYGLELEHNISFSRVYSDYIIDKTYTEGIIAEDKLAVTFSLLSVRLIKDMVLSDFNRNYILYIPASLYKKVRKIEKLLRIIDDKYAKDNIYLLITFEDLLNNKQLVGKLKKNGYKFALYLTEEVDSQKRNLLYMVDYIFVDKNTKIDSTIPRDLFNKVMFEDIVGKIGDFEGDKE